jgi:hypothetical protein
VPNVVSPAYNQDFMTPDPESYFPGPEIFEEGVQGPKPTQESGNNNNNNFFESGVPNFYDDRYDVTQPPPSIRTVRPPVRPPPSSYQEQGQSAFGYPNSFNTDKVDNGEDNSYQSRPLRPNGPDYSTATILHHGDSSSHTGSTPFRVGLDLYPMTGTTSLGKQSSGGGGIYDVSPYVSSGEDNKHEVLLHLNLFSRKPTHLGGSRAQDIDLLSRYPAG